MIATTLEAAAVILAVEFALLGPLVAWFTLRGARSVEAATTSEATELVTKVADSEESRRLALETVFRDKYRYEGDELTGAVEEFMEREKAFYNAVVGAVLGRGDSRISDISDELTKVVAPWISITPKNMVDAASADAVAAEKDRIEIELGATKETLEKMIQEYNRAFRIDSDSPQESTDAAAEAVDVTPEAAEDDDLDYRTEELNDLDDVLDSIHAQQAAEEAPPPGPEAGIVNLDEEDDDEADLEADAEFAVEAAGAIVDEADDVDELESLDELDDDVLGDSPVRQAGKPMTADDLDELMESLDVETADESESA